MGILQWLHLKPKSKVQVLVHLPVKDWVFQDPETRLDWCSSRKGMYFDSAEKWRERLNESEEPHRRWRKPTNVELQTLNKNLKGKGKLNSTPLGRLSDKWVWTDVRRSIIHFGPGREVEDPTSSTNWAFAVRKTAVRWQNKS